MIIPMDITLLGIVTDVREEHPEKVLSPDDDDYGILW